MATNVGMLTIEMAANIARLQRDMNSATKTVDSAMAKITKSVDMAQKALGALGVGLSAVGLANFVKQAINVADETNKMSQKIGVSVKDIAGLQLAFRQAGVDAGGFQQGMTKLSVSVANGSKAFDAIGISTKNADGSLKSTRQVLIESADKFASYKDGIDKTALAVEIFGKAGANLIPLLNQGSKGIEEYDRKAKQLGLTLSADTAKAAEEFNDQLDLLGAASQGFATQLAAALLPALSGTINVLLDLAKVINDNKEYLIAYAAVFTSGALIAALPAIATGFMSVAAGITAVTVAMAKNPVALAIMLLTAAAIPAIDALVKMYKASKDTADGAEEVAEATGKAAPSLKAMEEELKKNIEAAKLANEAWDEYFKTLEEGRLNTEKAIKSAREIVEDLEFEAKALQMTNAEREIAIRLRKIEAAGLKEGSAEYEEMAKRIRSAYLSKDVVQQAVDRQKEIADEWKKSTDQMNQSLTDALMRGFESGKGFAENFKQVLINMFQTMVLRPLISPIVTGATGMLGFGGTANAAGGAMQTASTLSTLNNIYSGVKSGFANLGASVGAGAQYAQTMAGSTYGTGFATQQSSMLAAQEAGMANTGFAQGAGTAASYLGGALVGYMAGKMISGGYSAIGKSGNAAVVAGTAIGAMVGGPIGAAIGGAIGGAVNRVFGRKLTETGVLGTFGGATGFEGQSYKFEKGGFARSDKMTTSALPESTRTALASGFFAVQTQLTTMATSLGQSAQSIADFTYKVKLNFMGLTDAQIEEKMAKTFGKISEQMADLILSGTNYAQSGEKSIDTLTRLYNSLTTVNSMLDTLNLNMYEASLAGADLASSLADGFGGLNSLTTSLNFYYENFYSEAERAAKTTDQLTTAFTNLGYTLPKTREEFRLLIASLDLTTVKGKQTFTSLINLAPAFASIVKSAEDMLAQAKQTVASSFSALERIISKQKESIRETQNASKVQLNAVTSLLSLLKSEITSIYSELGVQPMSVGQAQSFIDSAIATARAGGGLPSTEGLSEAIGVIRTSINKSIFATSFEAARDRILLAGKLTELQNLAGEQKTGIEKQIEVAEQQLASLDTSLSYAQAQLDQLNGINTGIMTVEQAMNGLTSAISAQMAAVANVASARAAESAAIAEAAAAAEAAAKAKAEKDAKTIGLLQAALTTVANTSSEKKTTQYKAAAPFLTSDISTITDTATAISVLQAAVVKIANTSSEKKTADYQAALPYLTRASGGYTPAGLTLVGEEGPELVNFEKPSMIYNAGQTNAMINGEVAVELRNLREENKAQASAMVGLQARVTRLLERWDGDGLPETRAVA